MTDSTTVSPQPRQEASAKSILEWLALAHGHNGNEDAEPLRQQLLLLREAALPSTQRIQLLDLLFGHTERIVNVALPGLRQVTLPISRKLRQRARAILELLATLAEDYFDALGPWFNPQTAATPKAPPTTLRRATLCVAWQIRISQLIASPMSIGLWQQLHSAFRIARQLGLADVRSPRGGESIHQIYTWTLLSAIAEPASFCSDELEFIQQYLRRESKTLELSEVPPANSTAIFWTDLDKDVAAHALIRRLPPPDAKVLYFSCDAIARDAREHLAELNKGVSAVSMGLPIYAETRPGKGVLRRLCSLWGDPTKRRFSRRRQSYRVHLCTGFDNLWRLIKPGDPGTPLSEWMVTNESPDGYALMHMAGETKQLRVGDIVALQPFGERAEPVPLWHICIARWALSENPEHVELGLQLLTSGAMAAHIAQPSDATSGKASALLLPATPPLRRTESIVVPTGALRDENQKIIVLLENKNLEIREVRTTGLEEQTSSIEVFSISPDETP